MANLKIEFYGDDGYCMECKQPLEGSYCPYCGWEDKRKPQYKYEIMEKQYIIIERNMSQLSLDEQEKVWILSRTNNVFEKDCNGELWQILDCTK